MLFFWRGGGVLGVCDAVIERDHTVSFSSNACEELKTAHLLVYQIKSLKGKSNRDSCE
jgi:hypothetical protein